MLTFLRNHNSNRQNYKLDALQTVHQQTQNQTEQLYIIYQKQASFTLTISLCSPVGCSKSDKGQAIAAAAAEPATAPRRSTVAECRCCHRGRRPDELTAFPHATSAHEQTRLHCLRMVEPRQLPHREKRTTRNSYQPNFQKKNYCMETMVLFMAGKLSCWVNKSQGSVNRLLRKQRGIGKQYASLPAN